MTKKQELDMIAETDVKEILQPQYDKLSYKLRMQNKRLQLFCKNNDLQLQGDRTKVSGFSKKQSAIANGRATAYEIKLKKWYNANGIICYYNNVLTIHTWLSTFL